jgi:hypothetical protein
MPPANTGAIKGMRKNQGFMEWVAGLIQWVVPRSFAELFGDSEKIDR